MPPILILHCCIKGEKKNSRTDQQLLLVTPIQVENLASKLTKASIFVFINIFQGYGSILLLPGLIRGKNEERCKILDQEAPCNSVVDQLLIIALVTGAGNLFGRGADIFLLERLDSEPSNQLWHQSSLSDISFFYSRIRV